ncbi:MAG: Uma2 family endonuclease, partial [Chloroflexia bacterium]|nr:Uma2 family endonuclease [Chloroflexia bacterium]
DLEQGFEPDSCFYFENEVALRGKEEIDLLVDPPPDLVVEIDVTHSSLEKLGLFAAFRVPEVWRYQGDRLDLRLLSGDSYVRSDASNALPGVTADEVARLVREIKGASRIAWLRRVRAWAGGLAGGERDG